MPPDYFRVTRVNLSAVKPPFADVFGKLKALTDPQFDALRSIDLTGSPVTGGDLNPLVPLAPWKNST